MNIYVGNLSSETTTDDLKKAFEKFGRIVYGNVIKDKKSGKSKEYGFVGMVDDAEAHAAITSLNGADFMGCVIKVHEAQIRAFDRRSGHDRRSDRDRRTVDDRRNK